jgi:hypothetical protein
LFYFFLESVFVGSQKVSPSMGRVSFRDVFSASGGFGAFCEIVIFSSPARRDPYFLQGHQYRSGRSGPDPKKPKGSIASPRTCPFSLFQ